MHSFQAKEGGELLTMERSFPQNQREFVTGTGESTAPTAASARARPPAPPRWPVLARIPNVEPSSPPAERRTNASASSFQPIDYRFDPPEIRHRDVTSHDIAETMPDDDGHGISVRGSRPPAPHLRHRLAGEPALGATRSSRILPDYDPFAIPSSSLHDQIAPLVRFLVMVALFTVAGTSVLVIYSQRDAAAGDEASSSSVAAQDAATPAVPAPVAARPTLTPAPITASPALMASPSDEAPTVAAERANVAEVAAPQDGPEIRPAYPMTNYPPAAITDVASSDLPRVQTSDETPAVARLTGELQAVPPRTAQHVDEQSIH